MSFAVVNRSNTHDESGAFLPLLLVLLLGLFFVIGFVIDLSRLEATIRKAQNAVDAAALAGATNLETEVITDMSGTSLAQVESDGWANVKKSVLLSLAQAQMTSVDSVAESAFAGQTFRFDDTNSPQTDTTRDCLDYQRQAGARGNAAVAVTRHIFCYWEDSPGVISRQIFNVENRTEHFCKANAVSVELQLSNISTVFAHLMGIGFLENVNVSATAYMEEPIPAGARLLCESVNCSAIGIRSILVDEGLIDATTTEDSNGFPLTEDVCPAAPAPSCPTS